MKTCFDVGSNVGQTALELSDFFPNAELYCFEMVPETAAVLRKNVKKNNHVKVEEMALGVQPDNMWIQGQAHSTMNSLRHSNYGDVGCAINVNITTADIYCCLKGIEAIDVLKIDAQGCDLDVLKGAERMLESNLVCFVYTEVTFYPQFEDSQLFEPLHAFLCAHGFQLCGFYDPFVCDGILYFTNALYRNPVALGKRGFRGSPSGETNVK